MPNITEHSDLGVIVDNYATHKHQKVKNWQRFPTSNKITGWLLAINSFAQLVLLSDLKTRLVQCSGHRGTYQGLLFTAV